MSITARQQRLGAHLLCDPIRFPQWPEHRLQTSKFLRNQIAKGDERRGDQKQAVNGTAFDVQQANTDGDILATRSQPR
jgi:hypothetical protein